MSLHGLMNINNTKRGEMNSRRRKVRNSNLKKLDGKKRE